MNTKELILMKKAVQYVDDYIAIKPACELIGLDYISQYKSIKNDQILGQLLSLKTTTGADKKQYEMVSLPKHAFLMWVYRLQPGRILDDACRENLIKIQKTIHEYLYQGEQKATLLKHRIVVINNFLQEQTKLKNCIAESGRRLKAINKELAQLMATDPMQMEIPYTEPSALDYKPIYN